MESEYVSPLRAQLITTSSKQCTYFATDSNSGKNVFVKGPFKSLECASVGVKVFDFKQSVCSDLSLVKIKVIPLQLDPFFECQYGLRTKLKPGSYAFQVSDSILNIKSDYIPSKKHSSKTAWKTPVDVVDWAKIGVFSHLEYSRDYTKSIYNTDPVAAKEFVKHVLLSWICGCGADLALRNFIYDIKAHRVFQVDHESWMNLKWGLKNTAPGSNRTEAWNHLVKFVESTDFKAFFKHLGVLSETETNPVLKRRLLIVSTDWKVAGEM
jgi:hypothetical protein